MHQLQQLILQRLQLLPGHILFINKSNACTSANPFGLWRRRQGIGITYGHSYAAAVTIQFRCNENFGICLDSVVKNINVWPLPIQSFYYEQGCKLFFSYGSQFFGNQRGGYELALEFNEQPGDTSDLRNPTFTYLTDNLFFSDSTITNANGCHPQYQNFNTANRRLKSCRTILIPSAIYCADVQATFNAISQEHTGTYSWSFGDGTLLPARITVHVFSTSGHIHINLSFTTIHGCSGVFSADT